MKNNVNAKELNSMPLLFGKKGLKYQVDKIMFQDATAKRLMEIGFVKGSILELVSRENKGVIVKLLRSKIALDYKLTSRIYVHEYKFEKTETF